MYCYIFTLWDDTQVWLNTESMLRATWALKHLTGKMQYKSVKVIKRQALSKDNIAKPVKFEILKPNLS